MSGLLVERSTPLVSLQDGGRFGVRHLGVTQGGALDWVSMFWANALLGNWLAAPVLEIPLGGLTLLAEDDCDLALAGADLGATCHGEPLPPWRSLTLRSGQRLVFNQPLSGARAYLAAPGGFEAPVVMGSVATVAREALGGLGGIGAPIAAGDRLHWPGGRSTPAGQAMPEIPDFSRPAVLDLVLGSQVADFDGASLFDAFNRAWTVDSRSDRMGMRLLGPRLRWRRDGMVSEGIPLGAVQVPPDGQPIVLLNDRQTIGGYPRLGALTPLAVARLAQCLPGDEIRLQAVGQRRAQERHRQALATWREVGQILSRA